MKQHEFIPDDIILFLRSQYIREGDDFALSMDRILWDRINWAVDPLGYTRLEVDRTVFREAYCSKTNDEAYAIIRSSEMYCDWISNQMFDELFPQCIQSMKQTIEEL